MDYVYLLIEHTKSGNIHTYGVYETEDQGREVVKKFEDIDIKNGTFSTDRYEIKKEYFFKEVK